MHPISLLSSNHKVVQWFLCFFFLYVFYWNSDSSPVCSSGDVGNHICLPSPSPACIEKTINKEMATKAQWCISGGQCNPPFWHDQLTQVPQQGLSFWQYWDPIPVPAWHIITPHLGSIKPPYLSPSMWLLMSCSLGLINLHFICFQSDLVWPLVSAETDQYEGRWGAWQICLFHQHDHGICFDLPHDWAEGEVGTFRSIVLQTQRRSYWWWKCETMKEFCYGWVPKTNDASRASV